MKPAIKLIPKAIPATIAPRIYFLLEEMVGVERIYMASVNRKTATIQSLATEDRYI